MDRPYRQAFCALKQCTVQTLQPVCGNFRIMICVRRLQDDFGVDQEDVYEVVAAWNEHSEDVEAYVALQEDSGLDAGGLKEAVRQWREQKADHAQYEALRRDTGMDADGMRKVTFLPFFQNLAYLVAGANPAGPASQSSQMA